MYAIKAACGVVELHMGELAQDFLKSQNNYRFMYAYISCDDL
jgi:hypothetical protein